jgi:hypothetical protein
VKVAGLMVVGVTIGMVVGICVTEAGLTLDEVLLDDVADREVVAATVIAPAEELDGEDGVPVDMAIVRTVLNCEEPVGLAVKVSVTGDTMLAVVGGIAGAVVLVTSGNSREVDVEDVALELKLPPEAVV